MIRDSDLKGFKIKEDIECLIVKIFADDMTIYLSEEDNLKDLQLLLNDWCATSGKFNTPKTKIVPVGDKEFRDRLNATRKMADLAMPIPDNIEITPDGEAMQLLGAFIGNQIMNLSIWAPMIEQIASNLKKWSKGHPTIDGRCLIIGMVVGGHT
ncbi:hypothetical protein J132_09581 [Termitomyces sp. J132]|nr:hypothetical protein J132_09581 [Termitomyces sp. J132]